MTSSPAFRAVIFDMDGLMVDTERLYIHANQAIASSYGKTVTDTTLMKMMGRATLESLGIFAADPGSVWKRIRVAAEPGSCAGKERGGAVLGSTVTTSDAACSSSWLGISLSCPASTNS